MRFCMIMPTLISTEERRRWAIASFDSLRETVVAGLDSTPMLIFVLTPHQLTREIVDKQAYPQFVTHKVRQPGDCRSNDGAFTWAAQQAIGVFRDITHIFYMTDDWLYNPRWLLELQALVNRHPGAKAWWVYRSAYEEIHRTLDASGDDVLVRSINAGGCCTIEEWREWNLNYHTCPRENNTLGFLSLDLLHPQQRPGDRWVTKSSYILNIGLRGSCQRPDTPDLAVDFIGG